MQIPASQLQRLRAFFCPDTNLSGFVCFFVLIQKNKLIKASYVKLNAPSAKIYVIHSALLRSNSIDFFTPPSLLNGSPHEAAPLSSGGGLLSSLPVPAIARRCDKYNQLFDRHRTQVYAYEYSFDKIFIMNVKKNSIV
jgi:hypothetical protein